MKPNAYFAKLRREEGQETCRCGAYPFPHHMGAGKCKRTEPVSKKDSPWNDKSLKYADSHPEEKEDE